jgi:NAD dependent epimerase/dehydratase
MSWNNRKVLVTGADGFIGSHLVERLVALGASVRAFCFYNSNGSLGWLDQIPPDVRNKIEVRLGDIRDSRFVEESCKEMDLVYHLAALISIPFSYQAPESFVDTNIKGTLNVLEAVRKHGCGRMVNTSTSEVYGTPAELPIRETHPLQGQSPYSASKIAADKMCEAYACSFAVPVVTLRPFNTYGPRQSARAVLPTILVQLLSGKREIQLGNLDPRRDLTYVADTVEGYIRIADGKSLDGEVVQLGTGRAVSIREIFEIACKVLNVPGTIKCSEERLRPLKSEVMVLLSDPSRALSLLGWKAETSIEQGIAWTAEWLKRNSGRYDAERYQV